MALLETPKLTKSFADDFDRLSCDEEAEVPKELHSK